VPAVPLSWLDGSRQQCYCRIRIIKFQGEQDLYTGNILVSHSEGQFSDPSFLKDLETPYQVEINAHPGHQITKSLPRRIVEPATFPTPAVDGKRPREAHRF
jgi:hypothetical protein